MTKTDDASEQYLYMSNISLRLPKGIMFSCSQVTWIVIVYRFTYLTGIKKNHRKSKTKTCESEIVSSLSSQV